MLKIHDLVQKKSTSELAIILNVNTNNYEVVILSLKELTEPNFQIVIDVDNDTSMLIDFRVKDLFEKTEISYIKSIPNDIAEKIMRLEILSKVEVFYRMFHEKKDSFNQDTSSISYGGRVYDEREMKNLVDSSLDFWLTAGRFSKQFEKEFAEFIGVRYALLTNSGSSANLLAFSALTSPKLGERRIKPGDEVITVAAGFPTTVAPIIQNNAIPVFLDVELGTYNIIVEDIEKAITPKTKAIMIAHTMGNPFELDKVMEIANKYNLWVIEDNCDALGSKFDNRLTGTFGHIATSSFYPPHHMTMGEGGAVYTNDPKLKMIIESFRDWGRDCWCPSGCDDTCKKRFGWQLGSLPEGYDHKYTYSHIGYNLRVTDMQAAVGLEQLKKVPNFVQARKNNFNRILKGLKDLEEYFILPRPTVNSDPSWFGFILTIKDGMPFNRNEIVSFLEKNRIQTRMLFAGNLVRQPAFQDVEFRIHDNLKNTDKILYDTFLVGVYPGLNTEMVNYMISKIHEFVSKYK
ncbi:LPS biosynthesis protein [Paenibacillus marchantiophytorum]|uniref:LPS biosynthesis protein n=1 Tax=Paenibacillus marchantiophytorum TaxID=1619310 RepID=A0ABQ2BWH8_9BACL|nr:lipopolysaccharide biosynthesis protein RfbH [Paenibacillus marchantiophytorum]GGI46228.1 LPS biosynthesis protein [Paenibacillus marchantiophytorum]